MFVVTNPVKLYGRNVVCDLALRSGFADDKSFSPYDGMSAYVDRLWTEPTFASRESLFAKQSDFDADAIQPHLTEYDADEEETYAKETRYNPAVDKTDFDKYYRRLEDIPVDYLANYIGNLVYTICRLTGGVKAYNYNHAVAPTIIDMEDGSATDLADLELDYDTNAWSDSEVKRALNQLPYVLKRFLNLSCYTGVHVLSFVCSYMIAKEKNVVAKNSGRTKFLKKNAVIAENVWTCDSLGNAQKKVEISNKNLKVYDLFEWIEGNSTKYVNYRIDVTNFMHYVKVLNIDIREDMSKYGFDFANSLTVLTLTPNSQYNPDVYNALLNGTAVKSNSADVIGKTITRFNELCVSNPIVAKVAEEFDYSKRKNNFTQAVNLHRAYMMSQGTIPENSNYEFFDGFLYYNGTLAVIMCGLITDTMFADGRVILSELGYCVAVSDSLVLDLMPVGIAIDNMKIKLGRNVDDRLTEWWSIAL